MAENKINSQDDPREQPFNRPLVEEQTVADHSNVQYMNIEDSDDEAALHHDSQEGGSEPVDDVMPQANSAVDGDGALPDADEGLGGSFLRKKRKKDKKKKKQVDSWEADVPSSPTKSPSTDPAAATEPLETEQPAPTDAVKEEDDDDFGGAANKKSKKNKKGAKKKAEKDKADKAKSTANGKKNKNVSFVDPSSAELKTKPEGAVADNNDTLDESPVPSQEAPNDDKSDAQEDIDTQNSPAEDPAPESQDAPEEAIQAAVEEASSEPSPDQVDTISTTNIIPIESSEENVSAEQSAQRPPNDSATPEDVPEVEAEQTMPDSSSVELPHSDAPDELPESSSEDASNNTNTELPQLPADDTQVLDTPDESPKDETTAPLAEECRAIDEIENSTTGTDSKAAEPLESSVDVTVDETSNAMEQPTDSTPSDIAPASNVANTDAISEVPTVESALPPTESKDETSRGEGDAGTQLDENISATVVKTPDLSVDAGGDESGDVEQQPIESTSSDTAATSEAAGIDASIETQTIEAASLPPTESETVLDDIGDEVVDSSLSQSQEAESLDSDDLEQPSQPAVEITESVTVEDSDLTPAEHLAAEEPIVAEETAHSEDAVQIEAAIESDQPVSVSGDHVEVSQSPLETSKPIEETDENGDVEETQGDGVEEAQYIEDVKDTGESEPAEVPEHIDETGGPATISNSLETQEVELKPSDDDQVSGDVSNNDNQPSTEDEQDDPVVQEESNSATEDDIVLSSHDGHETLNPSGSSCSVSDETEAQETTETSNVDLAVEANPEDDPSSSLGNELVDEVEVENAIAEQSSDSKDEDISISQCETTSMEPSPQNETAEVSVGAREDTNESPEIASSTIEVLLASDNPEESVLSPHTETSLEVEASPVAESESHDSNSSSATESQNTMESNLTASDQVVAADEKAGDPGNPPDALDTPESPPEDSISSKETESDDPLGNIAATDDTLVTEPSTTDITDASHDIVEEESSVEKTEDTPSVLQGSGKDESPALHDSERLGSETADKVDDDESSQTVTSISASSADVPTKDDSGSVEPEKLEESFVTADPNTEHVAESDSAAEVSPQETGEAQELADDAVNAEEQVDPVDEPADTEPSSTSADNDASLPSTSVDMAPSSHGEIEEATADETIPPEAESVQDGVDQHEEITTNLIDDETPATLEAAPSGANETTLEEAAPESEVVPEATTSDIAQDNGGDINDASSEKNSEDGNAPIEEEQPEVVVLQEQPEQPATDLLENNPDNNTGPIVDSSVSDAVLQQEDPQSTGDHLPAIKEPDSNPPKESIETGEEVSQSLEQSSLAGQQETEQIQSPGDAADEELDAVAPSRDDIEDEKPEPDPQTTLDVADEKLEPEPKPVSPPADDVKDEEPESVSHATSDVVDKDAELEPPSQPTDDVKVEESQSVPQATGDVKEEEPLASTEEVRDEAMPQPEQPPTEPDVAVEPAQQPDIDAAKDVIVESTAEPEVDPVIVEPQTKGESDPSDEAVVQAPTEEIPVVEESKGPSVPSAPAEAASEAKLKEDQDEARDKLAEMSTPEGRKGKTESRIIPLGGTAPGVLMFQSRERRHESVVEGIYPRDQVISQGVDGDACQEKLADGHWITTGLPQDLDPAANEPRTSNLEDTEPFEHLDSSTSRGQSSVAQDIEKSMLEKDVIKPLPQDSNPLHKYNIRPDNIDTCMAGEPRSTISNATQPTEVPPQIESSTKQGNVLAPSDDASKVEKVDPPAPKELAQSASNGQISDISARDDPEATSLADHPTASVQELIVPQTLDMAEPSVSGKLEGEVIDANEGISEGDRNTPISEATTTLAESDSLLLPTTFDQGKGILDGETLNAQRQTSELVTPTENAGNHRGLVAGIATAAATVMTGAGTLVQKLSTGTELNNLPQQPLTNSLGLSPARSVYKRPSKTVRQLSSNFEAESLASSSDIPAVPPKSPERGSSPDAATRDSTREFETHAAQSQELSDLPAELNQTSIMSQSSPSKTSLRGHRQVNAAYSPSGRAPTDQKQTEPEVTIKGTGIRLTSALFGTQIVEDFGSNTIRNFGLANSQGFSDTRSSTPGIVLPDPTDPKAKALGRAKSLRRSRRRTLRSNEETVAAAVIIYATARELSPTSDTRLGSAHPGSSSPEIEEYGSRLGTSMAQGVAESRGVDMVNVDDLVTDSSTDDEGKRSGSDRHRRHRHSSSRSGETRSSDTKKDSQHRSRRESNASSVSATSDLFVGSKTTKRTDSGFSVDSSRSSRPQKTPEEQAAHEKRRAERRAERTPEEQALHEKHKEERRALREKEREREKLTEREPEGKGKGKGAELPQGDLPSHRSSRRYSQRSSSTRSEGAPRNDEPSTAPDRRSSELKAPNFLSRASEPAVSRASKDAPRPETARRSHTSKETSRKSNNAPQDREHRSSRGHHQHRHRDRSPSDKVKPPPRPANDVEADIPRSSKSVREPKESRDERPHRREERQKVRDAEAKKKQAPSGFKGMIKKIFA